jgi:hypothetical protein
MNKKQICVENKSFAYYSGFGGLELKHIEYGVEDYIYCVSGAWCSKKGYHKLKIYYDENGGYIKLNGCKIPLNECIRMN